MQTQGIATDASDTPLAPQLSPTFATDRFGNAKVVSAQSATFYTWQGTPSSSPQTLADAAPAWATNTAYAVGAVVRTGSGASARAFGCLVAGTSASSGSGPVVNTPRSTTPILDGMAGAGVSWLDVGVGKQILLVNLDSSAFLFAGNAVTGTTSQGGAIAAAGSGRAFSMSAPEAIWVAGSGSGFSVEVYP